MARTFLLKTVTTRLTRGSRATVRLALPAAARTAIRRALTARQRIVVSVRTTVADTAGNKRTVSRQVRLKR